MDSKYKDLGRNTILVFIGKFGSGIITFLMLPLYTRWLTPESFGLAELINTYANIIVSIATFCMADSIFIFPKTSNENGKKKYYSTGLFIAIVGLFLLSLIALFITNRSNTLGTISTNSFQIVALAASLFFQNYTQQFTRSIDKMKIYSICGIIHTCAVALFAFIMIPNYGVNGYIYSFVIANLIASLFTLIASKSYLYLSLKDIDKSHAVSLLKYGVPLIPNSIMWWLVDGINKPIMEANLGLSAVGIYAVASKFPSVLNIIVNAFSNAWGISVSEEYKKSDFNAYFNVIFKLIFSVLIFFSLLISIFSDMIISMFAAPEYSEASFILPVLLLSVVLSNASGLFGGIFMAMKQSKYFFYSSIFGALASIISIFFLIEHFGVYGVALSSVFSFFVMAISRAYFVWKDINKIEIFYYVKSLLLYFVFLVIHITIHGILFYILSIITIILFLYFNRKMLVIIVNKLLTKK